MTKWYLWSTSKRRGERIREDKKRDGSVGRHTLIGKSLVPQLSPAFRAALMASMPS